MYLIAPFKDIALAAGVAETVLQLRAAGSAMEIVELVCNFNGTEGAATPVLLELCRQREDGTLGTEITVEKLNPLSRGDIDGEAWTGTTAEPTVLHELNKWRRHPQSGLNYIFPEPVTKGRGMKVLVPHGERLGLVITSAAIVSCTGYAIWKE